MKNIPIFMSTTFLKLAVDEMNSWWNEQLMIWTVDEMNSWWNEQLMKWTVDEMNSWWNEHLMNLTFNEMNSRWNGIWLWWEVCDLLTLCGSDKLINCPINEMIS
jgi:hypothetical protein